MIIIGLTGGIGSGKSTVASVLISMGIPVFDSDGEAKKLYQKKEVLEAVINHFGEKILEDNNLSFKKLAGVIFNDENALRWINNYMHPLVQDVFELWKGRQNKDIVIKESAILIESNAYLSCDMVIAVEAHENTRINRVMQRDGATAEDVKARISRQITDAERRIKANFIINNDGESIKPQVIAIVEQL